MIPVRKHWSSKLILSDHNALDDTSSSIKPRHNIVTFFHCQVCVIFGPRLYLKDGKDF